MLFTEVVAEGAECEQLEKVVIGNDEEKLSEFSCLLGRRKNYPQKKY